MKSLIAVILCAMMAATIAEEQQQLSRAKRFAGFGSFSTVGGRIGCVVSENGPGNASLYINSHFTKFLSEEEQQELSQYKDKLAQFKTDVKAFLEQRQQQALAAREQFRQNSFPSNGGRNTRDGVDQSTASSPASPTASPKQPEPPKKPSFCSEKATTQYVFDGCSVQGDNVYIGENFVRKLTEEEQTQLEQFDKQFTAYQKAITNNFKQQVEDIFGKHFGNIFETSSGSNSKGSTDLSVAEQPSGEGKNDSSSTNGAATAVPPETPRFCTLIV